MRGDTGGETTFALAHARSANTHVTFLEPGRVISPYLDVYTDVYPQWWIRQPYVDVKWQGSQRDLWYKAHVERMQALGPEAALRWLESQPNLARP